MKENRLVISVIGPDNPEVLSELCRCCAEYHCNVVEAHCSVLGSEFTGLLLVSGTWDAIAKLETALVPLARRLELLMHIKHTREAEESSGIGYTINLIASDKPGILQDLTRFLVSKRIRIDDMQCSSYGQPYSSRAMCGLNLLVRIPVDTHLATLRDEFMLFCDERNLDAVLEPFRVV